MSGRPVDATWTRAARQCTGVALSEETRDTLRVVLRSAVGAVLASMPTGSWCAFDLRRVLLEMAEEADPRMRQDARAARGDKL